MQHLRSSIEAAVRRTVRCARADGPTLERGYRGGQVKVNWTAGANEVMGTLNNAMVNVIQDIARDLPPLCGA